VVAEGEPLTDDELRSVREQVARVVSLDHDGETFDDVCRADPVLAVVHARAPGFRPALFYSPYEAAVWSIISARRARGQGIALRTKLAEQFGAAFEVAGVRTVAVPTPSQLAAVDTLPWAPRRPDSPAARGRGGGGRGATRRRSAAGARHQTRRGASSNSCPESARSTAP
jgi:3-methyladenine DNA glycosylase/8-oxoguanine DNA glycosylase